MEELYAKPIKKKRKYQAKTTGNEHYYQGMMKLVRLLPELMKEEIHMVAIRNLLIICRIDQTVLS